MKRFCTLLCGNLLKPCKLTLRAASTNSCANFPLTLGLSINYVDKIVGVKSTRSSALAGALFLVNWVEHRLNQRTAELLFGCGFCVQLGLLKIETLISTNRQTIIHQLDDFEVVIGITNQYCVCRRVSWLSVWCLTRESRKKCLSQRGETCSLHYYNFVYVVYG